MEFILQIGVVLLLVLLNGYFVASEFALVAVRKTRVDELVLSGNGRAKVLQEALKHLDSYISATQLGITLASLALGWIGEPAIAHAIEPFFTFLPQEAAFLTSHTLATIIAFSIITFLHIVLGEVAPKSIALQRAESTSLWIIAPLIIFTKVFGPFIWVLNKAGQMVLKLVGMHSVDDHDIVHSEEEIRMLLSQSALEGKIPSKEVEMVYNVFQLGDTPVKYVMVPRTDVLAFNIASPIREIVKRIEKHPHSRFPVYENTIDNVIGFVHVKDIYRELLKKGDTMKLSQLGINRTIISVPETKKIDQVLQDMRKKRIHIAVVNDEYGGTSGMVTLEDIMESLVGEIEDEFEESIANITKAKDGSYLINGHTLIEDFQDKFHMPLKGQGYTTIGGLVFGLLGHEPRIGDTVEISNLLFTIEEIEGKRIKLLKLKKIKKQTKAEIEA
ncbi:MAG: hemolysin family protein [Weeksellaceae bacterium]